MSKTSSSGEVQFKLDAGRNLSISGVALSGVGSKWGTIQSRPGFKLNTMCVEDHSSDKFMITYELDGDQSRAKASSEILNWFQAVTKAHPMVIERGALEKDRVKSLKTTAMIILKSNGSELTRFEAKGVFPIGYMLSGFDTQAETLTLKMEFSYDSIK